LSWEPPEAPNRIELFLNQLKYNTQQLIKQYKIQHKHYYKNKLNLSPTEWETLKELMNNNKIIIKPTDKNAGIAIIDKDKYKEMTLIHLNNNNVYNKVNEHTVYIHLERIITVTSEISYDLINSKYINKNNNNNSNTELMKTTGKYIIINNNNNNNINNISIITPHFYTIPKVHKNPISTRPITAGHSWPTQQFSKILAHLLQPFVETTTTYIKDSQHLIQKLNNIKLNNNKTYYLVTGDIESMYTNINLNSAQQVVENYYNLSTLAKSIFTKQQFKNLLTLLLKYCFVQFNGIYYQQIFGLPMGTSSAPPIASLTTTYYEKQLDNNIPILWVRFLDDIFLIFDDETKKDQFLIKYNNIDNNIKIKFTTSTKTIDYLDLTIIINNNNINYTIYQKPMSIFQYIPFNSYHRPEQKTSWIQAELIRYACCSSNEAFFNSTKQLFRKRLIDRGYPISIINYNFNLIDYNTIKNKQQQKQQQQQSQSQSQLQPTFFLKLPFNPTFQSINIRKIIPRDPPDNILIRISWSTSKNLGNYLVRSKFNEKEEEGIEGEEEE
jgi:hypothetical protein